MVRSCRSSWCLKLFLNNPYSSVKIWGDRRAKLMREDRRILRKRWLEVDFRSRIRDKSEMFVDMQENGLVWLTHGIGSQMQKTKTAKKTFSLKKANMNSWKRVKNLGTVLILLARNGCEGWQGAGVVWFQEVHCLRYCFKKRQNANWNISILVVVLKRCIFRHLGFSHHVPCLFIWSESVTTEATEVEEHRRISFGFHHRFTLEHVFHYRLLSVYQAVIGQVASMSSLSSSVKGCLGCKWFTSVINDGHKGA